MPASPSVPAAAKPAAQPKYYLDHAQPKLPTLKLWLGTNEIVSELAIKPHEIATGMMYRESLGENESMLFVLPVPQRASFYMKNTKVPLSAGYIGADGIILEIHDLKPGDETPVAAASDQVQYVLEVNQGWFARHQVNVGALVLTEHGPFAATCFGRR